MQIYLPIAETPVDIFTLLLLGSVAGFLSGMFGIGGGFLMTPLLIFVGVPPTVSVASSANQIIASSLSGFFVHMRKKNVDFKMGNYLFIGGLVGSLLGTWLFSVLKKLGQIDLVISLSYVFFLGTIGVLMAVESYRAIMQRRRGTPPVSRRKQEWHKKLPMKITFPRSRLHISILLPLGIGFSTGLIVAIMGIGGGFLTIPAMIYILGMPTSMVVGTSLFQMILITCNVTFFHAFYTQSVDIILAGILLCGSVVGVQLGTRIGYKLPADNLRGMLALTVIIVAAKMAYGLFVEPANPYTIGID